jgi:hypothetical protein
VSGIGLLRQPGRTSRPRVPVADRLGLFGRHARVLELQVDRLSTEYGRVRAEQKAIVANLGDHRSRWGSGSWRSFEGLQNFVHDFLQTDQN